MIECPACSNPAPDSALTCPSCNEPLDGAATRPLPPGHIPKSDRPTITSSFDSLDGGRFVPGEILAGRYRIVDMLGRGGMGEVYRAEDIKLRQPVALKFLPEPLAQDQERLERLYREVSVARQVSHRNVCRVYDIGEEAGHHFISMEFVRGEELGSLLKRIGRLPRDKALETARQLCVGLAAIHDKGILHRDLKPSNVMLDERGDVRITDFGLAASVATIEDRDAMSGTPAYMSPEQLAGEELTFRSDIYALGLLLYELFTGKRAFEAQSLNELLRLRATDSTPITPSSLIKDLDPLVEQTILRCLAPDPVRRPATALQVAAALPGGDPLAAALAMGETPSPEVVAAASKEGTLRPVIALSYLILVLVGTVLIIVVSDRVKLYRVAPLEKSPHVLSDRASEIIRKLGYLDPPVDSAFAFEYRSQYLEHIAKNDPSPERWDRLRTGRPPAMVFWYRESPRHLVPIRRFYTTVNFRDPPRLVSGMKSLRLDPDGRLLYFEAVPPQIEVQEADLTPPDWNALFVQADLEMANFAPTESNWVPPSNSDVRAAWEGTSPGLPGVPIRIEAASFRGRPVYFQIIEPWTVPERVQESAPSLQERIVFYVFMFFIFGSLFIGGYLAWRNARSGIGDRKGAFRLAAFVAVAMLVNWIFRTDHVPTPSEFDLFAMKAMETALVSAVLWLMYMSLEPYVRRWWPHRIISWNRLLAGNFRDPLVGRDVLLGCLFGVVINVIGTSKPILKRWLSQPPEMPGVFGDEGLLGIWSAIGGFADGLIFNILFALGYLFLFLLLFVLLRKQWLATVAFGLFMILFNVAMSDKLSIDYFVAILSGILAVFVLTRLGLLSLAAAMIVSFSLDYFPLTTNLSVWYADVAVLGIVFVTGLAVYAFYTSLGGQPLLRGRLMPD